jgi:antitoxin YobK
MADIASLIAERQKEGCEVWIAGRATSDQLVALENALGVSLPPSYATFLSIYGALGIDDRFVSGIFDNNALDQSGGSVLGDTLDFQRHNEFPRGFVVVNKHEDGAFCLDTNRYSQERECAVVNFEFGSIQHAAPVALSFHDWLIGFFLHGDAAQASPNTSFERTRDR